MSEEKLNSPRIYGLPILDLTHLDPDNGITSTNVDAAITDQGIDTSAQFDVRLPNPSATGSLVLHTSCFAGKEFLTHVIGLNKVDTICSRAFSMSGLTGKIWIDNCINLGVAAFEQCCVEEVVLSPKLEVIPVDCFLDCNFLGKVQNLNKVKKIESRAFGQCEILSGKIWIDNCTSLGDEAFCDTYIEEIVLNPNLQYIPNGCFAGCTELKKVYNINKIEQINDNAFGPSLYTENNCGLSGKIWIDNCTNLGISAFTGSAISEIVLSKNLESIPDWCFEACSSLTKIYNLNKIKNIGECACSICDLTGKIWIDNCTSLGSAAFNENSNITSIVIKQELYETISDSLPEYAPESVNWIPV